MKKQPATSNVTVKIFLFRRSTDWRPPKKMERHAETWVGRVQSTKDPVKHIEVINFFAPPKKKIFFCAILDYTSRLKNMFLLTKRHKSSKNRVFQ